LLDLSSARVLEILFLARFELFGLFLLTGFLWNEGFDGL
jgi:hypothetical protein